MLALAPNTNKTRQAKTNQQALCSREIHSRSTPASPMDQPPWFRAPHTCGSHLLRAQRLAWRFTGSRARSSSSSRLPRRRIHVPRRPDGGASANRHLWISRRGSEPHTCAAVIFSERSVWSGGSRAPGPALRRVPGSQGVEFMCCADSKMVRCSHATNGETFAVAGVTPVETELQPCSMPETVLPSPQYVLARNISKK